MVFKAKELSPKLSVHGQIYPADIAAIKGAGFDTIINNRPDGEDTEQPTSVAMQQEAELYGIDYFYLPMTPGEITDELLAGFKAAVKHSSGPILAHCRTGKRSAVLWSQSQVGRVSAGITALNNQ